MKIAKNENEAIDLALNALEKSALKEARIDEGSYKGGLYDCYFILHPQTGEEIFSIAF